MNRIFREHESDRAEEKGCLLRLVFTEDLETVRYDLGSCKSAKGCLLPKQGAVGSNPITRSMRYK